MDLGVRIKAKLQQLQSNKFYEYEILSECSTDNEQPYLIPISCIIIPLL